MLRRPARHLSPPRLLSALGWASILLGAGGLYLQIWPLNKGGLWAFIVGAVLLGMAQLTRRPVRYKRALIYSGAALLLFAIEEMGPGLRPLMNGHLKVSLDLISIVVWLGILGVSVLGCLMIFGGPKSHE
jgi:hypothetical protein